MDASYPYTVTLDSPYSLETQTGCNLFRQGNLASGVAGYQYVITFDSNVGDLPALTVDGSGLWVSNGEKDNATKAEVRLFFSGLLLLVVWCSAWLYPRMFLNVLWVPLVVVCRTG